ncbi:MAG: M23 family metallopeptidase [Mariniphaga sp.]
MKQLLAFFLSVFTLVSSAQDNYYTSPVKIPIYLSGSFAELRSNHFHSGIDIKTQQTVGHAVHSVAEGFISRIVVSPAGFGNALYIDHPNGTTSVYAHLQSFRKDIQDYVRDIQYKKQSFRIDEKVPADRFPVKQDEIIAKSGNSGSSGGPHVHFEIRDTESEEPLNPLYYNFPVTDNIAPKLYSIMVVPLNEFSHVDYTPDRKIFPVVFKNGRYHLQNSTVVPAYGNIGIAVEANDFFDGSHNRCGIYSMKVWFDGELYFDIQMDRFSFHESRYINSYTDYGEYVTSKRRFQKAWIDPGNRLRMYNTTHRGGNLKMTDGNYHPVKIELKDLQGNTSVLEFTLASRYSKIQRPEPQYSKYLRYDRHNEYKTDVVKLEFPEEALYNDIMFRHREIPVSNPLYSDIHVVHNDKVPLHNNVLLSIKAEKLDKNLQDKALLVKVDTLTNEYAAAGGVYDKGWVTGHIRSFGNYGIAVDTVPPEIIPMSFRSNGELSESSRIRFRINDELSGIKSYEGLLNGNWALFEYDAKTNTIVHYFDEKRFELGKRHRFVLTVTDYKDNKTTYEASFWK